MSYEVHWPGGIRSPGTFAVLDSALNEAQRATRPPPTRPAPVSSVARQLKTSDTDPYELLGPYQARQSLSCRVVEVDPAAGRGVRVRAFVDDGVITWAIACKACSSSAPGYCSTCEGLRAVRDRT